MAMRTIGVVTASREDYDVLSPLLRRIEADNALTLRLLVTGSHLWPLYHDGLRIIENDGFRIAHRQETLLAAASPAGEAKSLALALQSFADYFAADRPDILMIVGDGNEMMAAALAARSHRIPVAHLHGGGVGEREAGDTLRHTLTKLSHLHFVATRSQARRVRQLGEESWRIEVSGSPLIEHLRGFMPPERRELESAVSAPLPTQYILVALEVETRSGTNDVKHFQTLLRGIEQAAMPALFLIDDRESAAPQKKALLTEFAHLHSDCQLASWPDRKLLLGLIACSSALVGNTAHGIVLGPTMRLPVVNIGERLRDMERPANVLDADWNTDAIAAAILRATDPLFRQGLAKLRNPYGDGLASERIVDRLRNVQLGEELLDKRFFDTWSISEGVMARAPMSDIE